MTSFYNNRAFQRAGCRPAEMSLVLSNLFQPFYGAPGPFPSLQNQNGSVYLLKFTGNFFNEGVGLRFCHETASPQIPISTEPVARGFLL